MYDPEQITFFAKTDARGQQVPFGIKANDRTRHVYVIGKTGMGKSTLLENMAVQDIKNGNGLAFIDPHGQTAETLLDYIPEERKNDVVYFAPFDTENPVSFNVMEDVGADKRHLVVSGLMSVFKKIWVDAWSARMEYILSNTLLALLEYPDSTLLGVNRMLSDKEYRMRVIENVTDPAVKSFWVDEFLKYNERYMQEAGDAIKNKIGQFTSNPLIRNIIGQPHSSFDIREIMDDKKIMIMNLSKGLVGEQNANLLGSMLTTRIYLAAMSRADKTPEEMKEAPNFYFYVDEFQSFANATFADILSEARKYKLNLTIAHQYIEQMEEEVRNAVFGNVGTIISFRVGPFDAEILETVYTPKFLAPDIVNLGFAQIYLTLMIDGIGSQPFSAVTLPPIEQTESSCRGIVVARSRELYTKKRGPVEEEIHAWHDKSFSNKPPYVPKHLREEADGGTLPNTGENLKKYGPTGGPPPKNGAQKKDEGKNGKDTDSKKQEEYVPYKERMALKKKLEEEKKKSNSKDDSKTKEVKTAKEQPSDTAKKESKNSEQKSPRDDEQKKDESSQEQKQSSDNARIHTKHAPREKSLDDLRSVLKNISGDSDKNKKEGSSENKKNSDKTNTLGDKKDDSALKGLLASVLAGVDTHTEKPKEEVKVSEIKSKTEDIKTDESAQKPSHDDKKEVTEVALSQREKVENKLQEKQSRPKEQGRVDEQNKNRVQNRIHEQSRNRVQNGDKEHNKNREQKFRKLETARALEKSVEEKVSTTDDQREYAQMKNIDDPLAVKKLERMMRTNVSDKPPIK